MNTKELERLEKEMADEKLSGLQDQQQIDMCICGEKINDCPDAYAHMSDGV